MKQAAKIIREANVLDHQTLNAFVQLQTALCLAVQNPNPTYEGECDPLRLYILLWHRANKLGYQINSDISSIFNMLFASNSSKPQYCRADVNCSF